MDIEALIAYVDGELLFEETVEFFQTLIDEGVVWKLQGSYGGMATELIRTNHCTLPGSDRNDESPGIRPASDISSQKESPDEHV